MTRFGDFTLLEDLGRSAVSDRYRAMHATQGGPFFLKVYTRLAPALHVDLMQRCDALIGHTHEHLARHLGHGVVDGLPFVVSPFLEGVDLGDLSTSLHDRRVVLGMDAAILVLADVASSVGALQVLAAPVAHGDVSLRHVRVGPDGQVWLTGLTTPRGDAPGRAPDARWDLAGVGALMYDLVPILRSGGTREPLPAPLDRVVRRALGIGPREDQLSPSELNDRLHEAARTLGLRPDRHTFAELVRRSLRVIEKRLAETRAAASPEVATPSAGRRLPSDQIPSLDPVDAVPTLEPVDAAPMSPPARVSPVRPQPVAPRAAVAPPPSPSSGTPSPAAPSLAPPSLAAPSLAAPSAAATGASAAAPAHAAPPAVPELIPISTVERPAILAREGEATTRLIDPPRNASVVVGSPGPYAVPPPRPAQSPIPSPSHLAPPATTPIRAAPPPRGAAPAVRGAPPPPPPLPPRPLLEMHPSLAELPPDLDDPLATPLPPRKPAPPSAPPPPRAPAPRAAPEVPPRTPPPLPGGSRRGIAMRPLLADPDEPRAPENRALAEPTHDTTDPEQHTARVEQVRRDAAIVALLKRGVIAERALDRAVHEHLQRGGRVLEILVAQGATTDAAVADALSAAARAARITDQGLTARRPSPTLARRMPQTYLLARRVLPLSLDAGKLVLAVADPFDAVTVDELRSLLQATQVELLVAARASITAATVEVYRALSGVGVETDAPTILLCTPDESKATRLGGRLVQEGMRVEHVVDGQAAEEILRVRPPAAIICAHDLPTRNAQALLLLAREQPQTAELPFFVIGPREDSIATRLLDLGADDYFGEPLRLEVILAKVRRAAGKGTRSSAEGGAVGDRSGIFSTPPQTARPVPAPPRTPAPIAALAAPPTAAPVPRVATTAPKAEPHFLDSVGGLDDLPELPPDFVSDDVLQPAAPSMPTGVMGTLRQMPVPEIVQSLEMGRKTARVDLVPSEGEKGMIAFETGAIRYAECGALRGDEAFFMLARHKEGFFRIHYGDKPPEVNIEAPTTFLLLEAMRRMDEEGVDLDKHR